MSYQDTLQAAVYKAQDRLGDFLKCGNRLLIARERIKPYLASQNKSVASTASGLDARVTGMLSQLDSLQRRVMSDASSASDLKAQLDKDPSFMSVGGVAPDWSNLGAYAQNFLNQKVMKVASVAKTLGVDVVDMNSFIGQTADVEEAVVDLDDLAAGKGVSAKLAALSDPLNNLMSGFNADLKILLIIAGVGGAIWLFGPSLLGRSITAVRRSR